MHLKYVSAQFFTSYIKSRRQGIYHTRMADTSIIDLNAHFMCFRRRNLNILDAKVFAGFPGNRCLKPSSQCHVR